MAPPYAMPMLNAGNVDGLIAARRRPHSTSGNDTLFLHAGAAF
jgi:hypothetical protein